MNKRKQIKLEDPLGPIEGIFAGMALGLLLWIMMVALIILAWTAQ